MSVRVMTAVWALDLPDSEKLVLLALADCANDEGGCWPSMATLAKKCSKTDRTVQAAIKELVSKGHLDRVEIAGKGCRYTVTPRSGFTPEAASPPKRTTPTPEAASDKPSRTISSQKATLPEKRVSKPADVTDSTWADFTALRRQQRAPPSITALAGIAREAAKAGWSMDQALAECCARGWRGFKAEWVSEDRNAGRNGTSIGMGGHRGGGSASGLGPTVDAMHLALARTAGHP